MYDRPNSPTRRPSSARHLSSPEHQLSEGLPLLSGESSERGLGRRGLLGGWLNLTAPRWPDHPIPIEARERLRKAELTSYSILAIFACLVALVSNSLSDVTTAEAVIGIAIVLLIAAVLNRAGRTRIAAYLVPSVMMLIMAANLLQGNLELIDLPIYDLFAIPIILVALIGDRSATWVFAAVAITFVVGSYAAEPHVVLNLGKGVTFDGLAYEQRIFGVYGMVSRHVTLLFFAAFFGWMGARSVDQAIARADRAEEVARLQATIAQQKHELEVGIQQILDTHVRVANGDYAARAPETQDYVFWQIGHALNNLITRVRRNADAEHTLERTRAEVNRLLEEIQRVEAGQRPIWPQPSGTPLDPLIQRIAHPSPRPGFSGD